MIPTVSGAIVLAIGIWCQLGGYRRTVLAMFGLIVLASASAVDLPALGGASITPANFFLLFYLLRLVSMRDGFGQLAAEIEPRRPLFLFFLLILWIVGSALLLPRLFEGQVSVFSLSRSLDNDGGTMRLAPTSGNISQAVYAIGGFLAACATAAFARRPGGYQVMLSAIVLVTSLDIFFAIVDLVTGVTHTGFVLDAIHTASYAFLTDDELGGLKRISGSFSEASGFATFSLTLLGTNLALFVANVRPRFTGTASALLFLLIVLATSSAGYAGIGVLLAGFLAYAAVAALRGKRRAPLLALFVVGAGIVVVGLVFLLLPPVADVAQKVIEESLLAKGQTESALERGSWNTQAWQVFLDTHGLGAGIGTTRGSNYILVLLSNLGAIGFGLFALLMLKTTLARLAPHLQREDRAIVWAARVGTLVTLVPSILVGTVYDLGTLFYALLGIAASGAAVAAPKRAPAPERRPLAAAGARNA
ncbi:hypothetical protein RHAL1_02619 [Beijerinckiaceae bacterium RH AL1]|nr:hypothetical protein [Beijerinckiaceae bacterium]VVB47064.1 hypothetical protein RHCH11_RHCH11_02564 [Beijerinckiaceae bacterium RH CH11]VVB47147.1 hypothetical protein RHAL8_02560 [Beijerinckiaceae bacterium RH AL8]VVC55697.1 hypothetical protein RHAL1_02619 [Beijerinckiaceae bacterium RH AL1]